MTDNISITPNINSIDITQEVNSVIISSPGPQGPIGIADPTSSVAYAVNSASSIVASSALFSNLSASARFSSSATISASSHFSSSVINGLVQTSSVINSYINLSTTQPTQEGSIFYDPAVHHSLNLVTDTATPQELGQQILARAVNGTLDNTTLTKGTIVYISGATGNRVRIDRAIANDLIKHDVLGMVYDDIANNAEGFVLTFGVIDDVNTGGYTAGDVLYLSDTIAGHYTNIAPSYPNYRYEIGVVSRANTNNGRILLNPNASYNSNTASGNLLFSDGYRAIGSSSARLDYYGNASFTGNVNITGLIKGLDGFITNNSASILSSLYVSGTIQGVSSSAVISSSALTASSLGGIVSSSYALQSYVNTTSANVLSQAQSYTNTASLNAYNAASAFTQTASAGLFNLITSASQGIITSGSVAYARKSGSSDFATNAENSTTTSQTSFSTLTVASGATIGGNLSVTGNFFVSGTTASISASNLVLNDPLLYLADGNPANINDIGIVGSFTPGASNTYQHTGFVRDATDNTWKLFSGVVTEPTNTVDFTSASYDSLLLGRITASPSSGVGINVKAASGSFGIQVVPTGADAIVVRDEADTTSKFRVSRIGGIAVGDAIYSTAAGNKAYILPNGDTGAMLINTFADTNKGLVVRAYSASQTANLQEWQNSAGTVLGSIGASGGFTTTAYGTTIGLKVTGAQGQWIQQWLDNNNNTVAYIDANGALRPSAVAYATYAAGALALQQSGLLLTTGSATNVAARIQNTNSAATADLTQWQNSAGTVLSTINASGQIVVGGALPLVSTSAAMLSIYNSSSSNAGIIIKMAGTYGTGEAPLRILQPSGNLAAVIDVYGGAFFNGGVAVNNYISAAQHLNVNQGATTSQGATLALTSLNAASVGIIIKPAGSQTADLQQWQGTAGTARVSPEGYIRSQVFQGLSPSAPFFNMSSTNILLDTNASATIGIIIRGVANQTADLMQIRNSSGSILSFIDSNGFLTVDSTSSATPSTISARNTAPNANNYQIQLSAQSGGPYILYGTNSAPSAFGQSGAFGSALTFQGTGRPVRFYNTTDSTAVAQIQGTSSAQTVDYMQFGYGLNGSSLVNILSTINSKGQLILGGSVSMFASAQGPSSTSSAMLSIYQSSSINGGIIVRNATNPPSGVSAFETQGGNGQPLFAITGTGALWFDSNVSSPQIRWGSSVMLNGGAAPNSLVFSPYSANRFAMTFRGLSGQTGDLLQFQDPNASALTVFNAAGQLIVGSSQPLVSTSAAMLSIYNSSSNNPGIIIRKAANQSNDLQQWQNTDGGALAGINNVGGYYTTNRLAIGFSAVQLGIKAIVGNNTSTDIGLVVRGTSGQTGDLLQVQDVNASALTVFNSAGQLIVGSSQPLVSTSAAMISVYNSSSNTPGIIVRTAPNHPVTVNIQEWQNSAGTALARIDGSGNSIFQTGYGNFARFGNWAVSPTGAAIINSTISSSTQIGIAIRSASFQSANIQQWQDSAGTVLAYVDNAGGIYGPVFGPVNQSGGYISTPSSSPVRIITNASATQALVVRGAVNQSADLQQWQNSNGAILSEINASGQFTIGGSVNLNNYNFSPSSPAMLSVISTSSVTPAIIVRAASGALGAGGILQEWQNAAGNAGTYVRNDGFISSDAGMGPKWNWVNGFIANVTFAVTSNATGSPTAVIKAANNQTANIQEWWNSANTVLSAFNASGQLTIGSAAPLISTSAAMLSIYNSSSNTPGLIIRTASLAVVDVQQWQSNDGSVTARLSYGGKFAAAQGLVSGANSTTGHPGIATLYAGGPTNLPLVVLGAPSQSANIGEWRNSAGASVVAIDPLGNITASGNVVYNQATNAQTVASYTLILSDSGKFVEMNNAGLNFVTIPSNANAAFATGARIDIIQTGAGNTVLSASTGVTLNFYSPTSATTASFAGQWAGVTLVKRATDTWAAIGNIK